VTFVVALLGNKTAFCDN